MEVAAKSKPAPNAYTASALDDLMRVGRLISRFSHGSHRFFLLALGLLIAEAATAMAALYTLAYLVDYLSAARPALLPAAGPLAMLGPRAPTVLALAAALLLCALLYGIAASQAQRSLIKGGRQLGFGLRAALQSQMQTLSLAFYGQRRTGSLLAQIADDIASLEHFVVGSLHMIGSAVSMLALAMAALFLISWPIALLVLGASMLLAAVSAYFAERISIAAANLAARDAELAASTRTMLATVSGAQAQDSGGQQLLGEQSRKSTDAALEADAMRALSSGVTQMLQALTLALLGLIGVWLVGRGALSVGALVFSLALVVGVFKPIKRIAGVWSAIDELAAGAERIGEVLDRDPAAVEQPDAIAASRFAGAIAFRNVSFAYQPEADDGAQAGDPPPQMALRDVSFAVAPGEALALVGDEAAGKSAIVQLLPRLYDPQLGQVLIDELDIRTLTLNSLRAQIGLVTREVPLLSGSVAEAIAQGCGPLPREAIIAAAMQANAHAFIERLPNGYDTVLGDLVGVLSAGQRQQLAIARAFIRNTPILILDEPTAGLDAESADLVLLALRALVKGKTTIIVSHEPDLIRYADTIVVIAQGQITQAGSHKTLLRDGGLYAELYATQLRRTEADRATQPAITSVMPAVAAGAKAAPLSPKNFHVMIQQAIPRPLAPQAFQTLQTQAVQSAAHSGAPSAGPTQGAPTSEGARTIGVPLPASRAALPPPGNATIVVPQISRQPAQNGAAPTAGLPSAALSTLVMPSIRADAGERGDERPALARAQLDPLQSELLGRELPWLKTALDEQAMRAYMQEALLGDDRTRYTVARCIPGKATYIAGQGCRLRYQLEVKDAASGQTILPLVNARVFAHPQQCDLYLRDHLAPLAELMRGRDEIAPFATPVAAVGPLNMAVAVFPIDGDLPTLVAATDRRALSAILSETLPGLQEGDFSLDDLRVDLAEYARRGRCVLRYTLYARERDSARPRHQVVYGKLSTEGNGAALGALSGALQQQVRQNPRAFQFSLPRVWGYRADMRLALLEALAGVPQLGQLLKQRLRGMDDDDEEALALEDALTVAASIANAVHSASISAARRRTLDHELDELRAEIGAVASMAPELGAQMRHWLRRIEDYAEESDPLPYRLNHGNFKYTKLIFDGSDVGLIDVDDLCQAEPALDLGHFQAYLRIAAQKTHRQAAFAPTAITDQLCAHFLEGYLVAAGDAAVDAERLRVRVSIYEAVTLLRAVVHSWQILKTSRIEHVIAVLEDQIARLPAQSY